MKRKPKSQDSANYTGRTGTGLAGMRFHHKTSTGRCLTCKSEKCIKTAYIPKMPAGWVWTWAEARRFYLAEVR